MLDLLLANVGAFGEVLVRDLEQEAFGVAFDAAFPHLVADAVVADLDADLDGLLVLFAEIGVVVGEVAVVGAGVVRVDEASGSGPVVSLADVAEERVLVLAAMHPFRRGGHQAGRSARQSEQRFSQPGWMRVLPEQAHTQAAGLSRSGLTFGWTFE